MPRGCNGPRTVKAIRLLFRIPSMRYQVCNWPEADLNQSQRNVRFQGYSGHDFDVTPRQRLMLWTAPTLRHRECHRVVALKRTTMRGAVHGRG